MLLDANDEDDGAGGNPSNRLPTVAAAAEVRLIVVAPCPNDRVAGDPDVLTVNIGCVPATGVFELERMS